jgi:hypothetical protein
VKTPGSHGIIFGSVCYTPVGHFSLLLLLCVRVGKRRVDEKRGEKVLLLLTAVEDSHRPALSPQSLAVKTRKKQTSS